MRSASQLLVGRHAPVGLVIAMLGVALGCGHGLNPDFAPPYICRTHAAVTHSVFLIGDAGDPLLADDGGGALVDPVLSSLQRRVARTVEEIGPDDTVVIFLGDNVYPSGLAPIGHPDRERGERILAAQVAAVGNALGYFTLGNHDWNQANKDGLERALSQNEYLSSVGPNISVHPKTPCGGPEVVDLSNGLRLVFSDLWSQIYEQEFPGKRPASCDPIRGDDAPAITSFQTALREALDTGSARRSVFVTHAPLITSGPHGGYFPWREHIFPLRVFNPNLWIPLPIIGTLFPVARLMGVTDTDMTSSRYRGYVLNARAAFEPGRPALVASGHEHGLQLHVDGLGVFHAVSGAGSASKVDYVHQLRSDLMSLAAPGYMRLDEHSDGTYTLEVIALGDDDRDQAVFYTCVP